MLKSILSGKGNLQKISKINDIPVNPLFDSELELRFMEAIRAKVGAANVSDTIRNGKHSYYVKFDNLAWEIEPQVLLGPEEGVKNTCKPDFMFWPVSAPDHLPVAVFTDGYLYHKDIVTDDTIKRESIRRSGNFRVWSLSYKDVQSVFAPQGDYATPTLTAEKMPYGTAMYQSYIRKVGADSINPAKTSPFDMLLTYLKTENAEELFSAHAYAYSLSLLDPKLMSNSLAFNSWDKLVSAVNDQTHFTDVDFAFPGTAFGSWVPRSQNAHLSIHAGIIATDLKSGKPVAVCAVLNDEKDARTDKYELEWNGFWQFFNVMQFSKAFVGVAHTGMERMDYLALPVVTQAEEIQVVADDAWAEIIELLFDDEAKAFVEVVKSLGIPAPAADDIGYELTGDDGEVVATIEIAWSEKKIGFMTTEQLEDRDTVEALGWKIVNAIDVVDSTALFGGDKQ